MTFTWDLKHDVHVNYQDEYFRSGYRWGSIAHFDEDKGVWCQSSCDLSESVALDTFPLALGGLEAVKKKYGIDKPLNLRQVAKLKPAVLAEMGNRPEGGILELKTVLSYFSWREYQDRPFFKSTNEWFFGEQLSNEMWNISVIDRENWLLKDPHEVCTTMQLLNRLKELKNQGLVN